MLKNIFTVGALSLLLTLGLAGAAFASDLNFIELDESDYNIERSVNTVVVQQNTPEPATAGWVNLIELDESDYEYAAPGTGNVTDTEALCAEANGSSSADCG